MESVSPTDKHSVDYNIFLKAYENSVSPEGNSTISLIASPKEDVISSVSKVDDLEPVQQTSLPIVGHRLSGYGTDKVQLTDSIDVLFYDSGDMWVEGFELGKDLLWFFLPEEVVVEADRRILDGGDLSLEFQGIGNLTFVGLLTSDDSSVLL
jgi:hypothetical protein